MVVVVCFDADDPPVGRVRVNGTAEAAAFVGWLGLLRVLSDLLAATGLSPPGETATEVDG